LVKSTKSLGRFKGLIATAAQQDGPKDRGATALGCLYLGSESFDVLFVLGQTDGTLDVELVGCQKLLHFRGESVVSLSQTCLHTACSEAPAIVQKGQWVAEFLVGCLSDPKGVDHPSHLGRRSARVVGSQGSHPEHAPNACRQPFSASHRLPHFQR